MNNINQTGGVIIDSFSGNVTVTKQYPGNVTSLAVANDGTSDIQVDFGYCTVTVKPDEVFDDNIVPQKRFTIITTGQFRCIVRGEC